MYPACLDPQTRPYLRCIVIYTHVNGFALELTSVSPFAVCMQQVTINKLFGAAPKPATVNVATAVATHNKAFEAKAANGVSTTIAAKPAVAAPATSIPIKAKTADQLEREAMIAEVKSKAQAKAKSGEPAAHPNGAGGGDKGSLAQIHFEKKREEQMESKQKAQMKAFREQLNTALTEGFPAAKIFAVMDAVEGILRESGVSLMAQLIVKHNREKQGDMKVEEAKGILATHHGYRYHCTCVWGKVPSQCISEVVVRNFKPEVQLMVWRQVMNEFATYVVDCVTTLRKVPSDALCEDFDQSHEQAIMGAITYGLNNAFPELTADVSITIDEEVEAARRKRRHKDVDADGTESENEEGEVPADAEGDDGDQNAEDADEDDFENEKMLQERSARKRAKNEDTKATLDKLTTKRVVVMDAQTGDAVFETDDGE